MSPEPTSAQPTGADAVPDRHGDNLYRADPDLARLLALYLPPDLDTHLAPHLDRLGALAGGELDDLAGTADRNPPVLRHRTRRGEDRQSIAYHPAYRRLEQVAFGQTLIALPLMQRQLAKMLVRAEQARSMMLQTAEALRRSDLGEPGAYALLRILTPLLKFRACRDARGVTGDAMEVRGGVGYIEEWPDARLLRDAHLGSIWEGTSNIVALDVLRAASREGALEALSAHVRGLLDASDQHEGLRDAFHRAVALAMTATTTPVLARQAASGLYHVTSAAALAWEATRLADPRRHALARMVLRHRVLPRDPLDAGGADDLAIVMEG